MQYQASSYDELFSQFGPFEKDARQLHEYICNYVPHLTTTLFTGMGGGTMLGYGLIPYKTKSMKEASEWPMLALTAQKHNLALYACAIVDGVYVAERYGKTLGDVSVGKSCIRFKKMSDLHVETFKKFLKELEAQYDAGYGLVV